MLAACFQRPRFNRLGGIGQQSPVLNVPILSCFIRFCQERSALVHLAQILAILAIPAILAILLYRRAFFPFLASSLLRSSAWINTSSGSLSSFSRACRTLP